MHPDNGGERVARRHIEWLCITGGGVVGRAVQAAPLFLPVSATSILAAHSTDDAPRAEARRGLRATGHAAAAVASLPSQNLVRAARSNDAGLRGCRATREGGAR